MTVIWGLDMKEMQWSKFGSKYMFGNTDYHLRRTKFVVYQLAMIFCVVSESLGTAVLSDLNDSQKYVESRQPGAVEHNDSYVGMASYNIFAGVYVATIFGAAFFFDLFWPERHEDRGVRLAWKGCSVAACFIMFASIILEVVIVTTKTAFITGVSPERAQELVDGYGGYPLNYRQNGRAIASVVFAWLGFPFVIYSTIIMWKSINHDDRVGPFSTHAQAQRKAEGPTSPLDAEVHRPNTDGATELNDIEAGGSHAPTAQTLAADRSRDGTYAGT